MIFNMNFKYVKTKYIYVEADSKEEALEAVYRINPDDIDGWDDEYIDKPDGVIEFQTYKDAKMFFPYPEEDTPIYKAVFGEVQRVEKDFCLTLGEAKKRIKELGNRDEYLRVDMEEVLFLLDHIGTEEE